MLKDLHKFSRLKTLTIRSVFVTDDGVASLSQLPSLRTLRLFVGPKISEEAVRRLGELKLTKLELTYSDATDAKLQNLSSLVALSSLRLNHAAMVTDEAVPFLSELTGLKELDVSDANISKAGLHHLRKSLPACQLSYNGRKFD